MSGIASGKAATLRMWSSVIADVGGVLLALVAALEHHLEGDPEQQQPARDAEGRDADAEEPQQHLAAEAEEGQDAEGDQAARIDTRRRSAAFMPRVSDTKIGASAGGSRVTSSVTRAAEIKSRSIGWTCR